MLSTGDDKEALKEYERTHCSYVCMGGTHVHTRDFDKKKIESLQNGLDFDDRDIGRPLGSYPLHVWIEKRRVEYTL